jgi:hypothetical protein
LPAGTGETSSSAPPPRDDEASLRFEHDTGLGRRARLDARGGSVNARCFESTPVAPGHGFIARTKRARARRRSSTNR